MDASEKLIHDTKRLMLARYPRFGSEIASANIEYKTDLKYHTAATDGKNIYFDPSYLASLSEDDRLFLIAHEIMHIKFSHATRLLDENGERKNPEIWNQATDAIINANLERDGFKIKDGYINRPEALKYSAEEFYQILLKEQSDQNNQNQQNGGQSNLSQNEEQQSGESNNNEQGQHGDDHSLWEEAFEKQQKKNEKQRNETQKSSDTSSQDSGSEVDEKCEFEKNRQERKVKAKENLERMREELLRKMEKSDSAQEIIVGDVGESRESIDWRLLLKREIEKSETVWSQRRSIAENNYAYRLEENEIEDESETEVMIDVSGSVDLDLVKAFLRVLKPILRHSKLKVGCFNEKFWGMINLNSNREIDNFVIPAGARGSSAWTEDWDLAVRSFTKKREINKIVFTDGYPCPGTMPKEDLKNENIFWLVYGNKNFHPCCGKVINITEAQLERLHYCHIEGEVKGRTI